MILAFGIGLQFGKSDYKGKAVAEAANKYLGCKYVFGADGSSDPQTFDCSGLTMYLYKNLVNISLPHSALEQSKLGNEVERDKLEPGDLIFFDTENAGEITHVGIYEGDNKFIAANTGSEYSVCLCYLDSDYWTPLYRCARRICSDGDQKAVTSSST